ncbi:MAG: metallophosphoesterase [Pseudomonadota bacterium]|nr:metallophosphoesterase [Pseudomonadota bacterium]
MKSAITARWALLSAVMAVQSVTVSASPDINNKSGSDSAVVRFIAIGDTGTGGEGQDWVAAAIEQVCQSRGCDFALGLGDNVYEHGVSGTDDPQFSSKFEEPFRNLNFPFYMVLGNHDEQDRETRAGYSQQGGFQVAYSHLQGRESNKWRMPARYYRFDEPAGSDNPLITFLSLDGVSIAGHLTPEKAFWQLDYRDQQGAWLDAELQESTAPWKIVFTHYPLYSNGKHGNAGNYGRHEGQGLAYQSLLQDHVCGKADVIFAGHDHDLEWLKPVGECGKTVHIVSGAGAKAREIHDEDRNEAWWQEGGTLGFFYVEIVGDELNGTVYTVDKDDGSYKAAFSKTLVRNS